MRKPNKQEFRTKHETLEKIRISSRSKITLQTVGWREWLSLPGLGIEKIKVKIDTGARTSALHAFEIDGFKKSSVHYIRFKVHPLQRRTDIVTECVAKVKDIRWVIDSGGHRERRYVIETLIQMAESVWPIELTLTNRDTMNFRMLLGRTAMCGRLLVDPTFSFLLT